MLWYTKAIIRIERCRRLVAHDYSKLSHTRARLGTQEDQTVVLILISQRLIDRHQRNITRLSPAGRYTWIQGRIPETHGGFKTSGDDSTPTTFACFTAPNLHESCLTMKQAVYLKKIKFSNLDAVLVNSAQFEFLFPGSQSRALKWYLKYCC